MLTTKKHFVFVVAHNFKRYLLPDIHSIGNMASKPTKRKRKSSSQYPSAAAHLLYATTLIGMANTTSPPVATVKVDSRTARRKLGKFAMCRDRILQQSATKSQHAQKNKLLLARANKRIQSMQRKLEGKTTAKEVCACACYILF